MWMNGSKPRTAMNPRKPFEGGKHSQKVRNRFGPTTGTGSMGPNPATPSGEYPILAFETDTSRRDPFVGCILKVGTCLVKNHCPKH